MIPAAWHVSFCNLEYRLVRLLHQHISWYSRRGIPLRLRIQSFLMLQPLLFHSNSQVPLAAHSSGSNHWCAAFHLGENEVLSRDGGSRRTVHRLIARAQVTLDCTARPPAWLLGRDARLQEPRRVRTKARSSPRETLPLHTLSITQFRAAEYSVATSRPAVQAAAKPLEPLSQEKLPVSSDEKF